MLTVAASYKKCKDHDIPEMLISFFDSETENYINIHPTKKEDMFSLIEALARVMGKITISVEN